MTLYARKFMRFFPLRYGVLGLSLWLSIGSMLVVIPAWFQVFFLRAHPLGQVDTVGLSFHITLFSALLAVSLAGLIGSIFKLKRLMTAYWMVIAAVFVISIASGAFTLFAVYQPNTKHEISRCVHGDADPNTRLYCKNGLAMAKGLAVAIYIITWLVLSWICHTAYSFAVELALEREELEKPPPSISNPTPFAMYNSAGVAGLNNGYAFSTVENSYGSHESYGSASAAAPAAFRGDGVTYQFATAYRNTQAAMPPVHLV